MRSSNCINKLAVIIFIFVGIIVNDPTKGQTDKTPPTVQRIKLFPRIVRVGERVNIEVMAEDDLSGIKDCYITFTDPVGKDYSDYGMSLNKEGIIIGTLTIPQFAAGGTWHATRLRIKDKADNARTLDNTDTLLKGVYFEVISNQTDSEPPLVRGVRLHPERVRVGERVNIEVMAEDDLSGIKDCYITFTDPVGKDYSDYGMSLNKEGIIIGTLTIPQFAAGGTWRATRLRIKDKADNAMTLHENDPLLKEAYCEVIYEIATTTTIPKISKSINTAIVASGVEEKSYYHYEKKKEKQGFSDQLRSLGSKIWANLIKGKEFPYEKSYALVIGVNEYQYITPSLQFSVVDAKKIVNYLENQAGFDEIIMLSDRQAIKAKIQEMMEHYYPQKLTPKDRLLFYYSGHATTRKLRHDKEQGYLLLSGTQTNNFYHEVISMDDIRKWSDALVAKDVLFVLDCCFSGLAGVEEREDISNKFPPINTQAGLEVFIQSLSSASSRYLLAAGTESEKSFGSAEWNGGLFTAAILTGLNGEADWWNDKIITVHELYAFLRKNVPIHAKKFGRNLTPKISNLGDLNDNGEFFFILNK